ncbi:LOG family protein [Ornatilinea apprima]|uniref:LOG family protein n=1 Tax=Ornatilinea apprima TaxID=1134406 RepID=UPI0009466398|nr:LOG family protein [Ornatilinea apprima]
MRISVFGSARPLPESQLYQDAYQLGRLLGSQSWTVLTGGYMGTMEAVSRGVVETGGHTIGVTCAEIEKWRNNGANPWVQEEVRLNTLVERIQYITDHCDAALALPGGPGTLTEISLLWNRLIIQALPPIPLILIGSGWQQTLDAFWQSQREHLSPESMDFLTHAPDVRSAFDLLVK